MSDEEENRNFQPRIINKSFTATYTGASIIISSPIPFKHPIDLGTKHDVILKPYHAKTSYQEYEEMWILHNDEPTRIFRREYQYAGNDAAKAGKIKKIKYTVDLEKQCQEKCALSIDNEFEFADGWIDCDGNFHGIASMQHENNIDDLRKRFNKKEMAWFFQNWVKISLSALSGLHIFSSEQYNRIGIEKTNSVTARQKLTIEKYLNKRIGLLGEGETVDFMGYGGVFGKITREDGRVKFIAGRRNVEV